MNELLSVHVGSARVLRLAHAVHSTHCTGSRAAAAVHKHRPSNSGGYGACSSVGTWVHVVVFFIWSLVVLVVLNN